MARPSQPVDDAYARLKEAGELRGTEVRPHEWLGCNPESLRRRAKDDGMRVSIARHPTTVRIGKAQLVIKLLASS